MIIFQANTQPIMNLHTQSHTPTTVIINPNSQESTQTTSSRAKEEGRRLGEMLFLETLRKRFCQPDYRISHRTQRFLIGMIRRGINTCLSLGLISMMT